MRDEDARRRIASDFHTNLLVEASAGSGKTHSLVSRLSAGILQGVYPVDKLVAVTFTRKAAAELSGRLRHSLDAARSGPQRQAAERALEQFGSLFIGTVHSFAARLLRQYPVAAGISPGFREVDDLEDQLLQRKTLRAALETQMGRRTVRLLQEFDAVPSDLLRPLNSLIDHGELDYPVATLERPQLDDAWQRLEAFSDFLEARLPGCPEPHPTCKILSLGQSLVRRVRLSHRDNPASLLRIIEGWESEPKPIKHYWGQTRVEQNQALEPVLAAVADFRAQLVNPQLLAWRSYLYSQCLPFLLHVRADCERERRSSGLVNFNDLLRLTCQLIRENTELRRHLQLCLCVDEFQDTDPLQAELLLLLAADDPGELDWERVKPRPGSLFLVGDPKQSIYRFRRADIETYNSVKRRVSETGGEVLALVTSFRSSPALCQWVNEAFTHLLPDQATAKQAAFLPLAWGERTGPIPAVSRLVQSARSAQEVAAFEAEQIAALIEERLTQGYRPADFLILTMRRAELRLYQQALDRAGIDNQVSADPVPLSDSTRSLCRLLQVVANRRDRITLVGVLRGPLFGHSDEQLFLHFQDQPQPEVAETLKWLDDLRQEVRGLPLGSLARNAAEKAGLHLQGNAEVEGLVDYLSERGQAGCTLNEALRELLEANAVALPPGSAQGVRIMNLHRAKGLEARVVFLAAPTSGLATAADHAVSPEGAALCIRRARKPLAHPPDWIERESRELEFLQAEQLRLLYVGTTRAREELIVGQWTGSHASIQQPWAPLHPFLSESPVLTPVASLPTPADTTADVGELLSRELANREARQACLTPSWSRRAVTANNIRHQPVTPPVGCSAGGAAWGDLIHRLLEAMVKSPEMTRDEMTRLARWFSFEDIELQEHLEAAVETVHSVRFTDFWVRVISAQARLAEVPFGHRVGSQMLFGIVDLALRGEEGWDVVDYKTDRKKLEDLAAVYTAQVSQYAESWSQIADEPVAYAGIYGVRHQQLTPDLRLGGAE